jgi:hypothetical protein
VRNCRRTSLPPIFPVAATTLCRYAIVHGGKAAPQSAKPKTEPPHGFILDAIASLNPEVRRMFSGFAVYVKKQLVFMLRDSARSP